MKPPAFYKGDIVSETPIGDEVAAAAELGIPGEPAEFDERSDDGSDEVPEDTPDETIDEPAPDVEDDQAEADEGAAEDENEDPGEAEPDEAPVVLESPYSDEEAQWP